MTQTGFVFITAFRKRHFIPRLPSVKENLAPKTNRLFSTCLFHPPLLSVPEHQSADEPGNQQVVMVGGGFSSLVLHVCLNSSRLVFLCTVRGGAAAAALTSLHKGLLVQFLSLAPFCVDFDHCSPYLFVFSDHTVGMHAH